MSRRQLLQTTTATLTSSFGPRTAISATADVQLILRRPFHRQAPPRSQQPQSSANQLAAALSLIQPGRGVGLFARVGALSSRQQKQVLWYTTAKTTASKKKKDSDSPGTVTKKQQKRSIKSKAQTETKTSTLKNKETLAKMMKKQDDSGEDKKKETSQTAGHKHERAASTDDVLKHPSTKRAKEIDTSDNPHTELLELMSKHNDDGTEARNVLHWFRSKDLRVEDNRALHAAAEKASQGKGCLLACFLYSPQDLEWHGTSPARTDFMLQGLKLVQEQLEGELSVPMVFLTAEDRGMKTDKVLEFVKENDVSHVYANIEYEVDELRRDVDMFKQLDGEEVQFVLHHDQTVVEPGTLTTGSGGPMKVFTPYHKSWLAEVSSNPELIDTLPAPRGNDKAIKTGDNTKALFGSKLPGVPESKQYASDEEKKRLRKLWPAGHAAGMKRLHEFLENKVDTYSTNRSNPAADNASRMSAYFSSGTVSVREALHATRRIKGDGKSADFSQSGPGGGGVAAWAREIVFREFYRHMMVVLPHNSMNLPQNLKFDFVQWEDDEEGFKKWCEGKTGVPFVDAGMRQINHEAYMHNRLRMNTSSYLSRSLLIDYRRGERYFAEHLVDWDMCNNTQGWEPSYTVFNPVTQAEKNDPNGDFIRRWVPELAGVEGKAVFDPYHRLSKEEFEKLGYPEPHVDFQESKQRCVQRYKQDMADADP